jgi:hypothetical protein
MHSVFELHFRGHPARADKSRNEHQRDNRGAGASESKGV